MFDPIYIYVPEMCQVVKISEGSGDNLNDEDIEIGYVDYIYYEQYVMDPHMRETDGGMVMLTELFQELFTRTADAIPDVLDMAYGNAELSYIVLD
jgi:hypothetical protein